MIYFGKDKKSSADLHDLYKLINLKYKFKENSIRDPFEILQYLLQQLRGETSTL